MFVLVKYFSFMEKENLSLSREMFITICTWRRFPCLRKWLRIDFTLFDVQQLEVIPQYPIKDIIFCNFKNIPSLGFFILIHYVSSIMDYHDLGFKWLLKWYNVNFKVRKQSDSRNISLVKLYRMKTCYLLAIPFCMSNYVMRRIIWIWTYRTKAEDFPSSNKVQLQKLT